MAKKVQILGTGCPKCAQLAENARAAIGQLGGDHEIEKVTDLNAIMGFGVMLTPALAVDGEVKSQGKVLSADDVKNILDA